MRVSVDKRIEKFLDSLPSSEKAKIGKLVELFREKGFLLNQNHLKKIGKKIWELRPGNVRLLFCVIENEAIIVNAFIKKTVKTPLKEIETAERRVNDYL